jgi:hypothetical protein
MPTSSPLGSREISVDFLTWNHYIFGQVTVSNMGILGLVSDPRVSQIEVNDATVTRIVKPDKTTNYGSKLWLAKKQLLAVCLSKREHMGANTMTRAGYSRLFQYPVHVTSPVYEFSGTLEWSGRFDFSVVMTDGPNPFLVFYDAILMASLFPALRKECPVIIFNRNYIDSMILGKTTTGA